MWENSISTFKNAEGTVENKEPESADLQKKHIQNMKNLYLSKLDSLQNHERWRAGPTLKLSLRSGRYGSRF